MVAAVSNHFSLLGILACRKASLVRGTRYVFAGISQVVQTLLLANNYHAASAQRGLLQLMALQPIAIDRAGADGKTEGAGSAEPSLTAGQDSVEASVEQVAVPSAPRRPSARNFFSFLFLCCTGGLLLRSARIFPVATKWGTSERSPNRDGLSIFLVHPYVYSLIN